MRAGILIMQDKKPARGVVILLKHDRLVLLTSHLDRRQAARLIQRERRRLYPLKFFPVTPTVAAATIQKINLSGVLQNRGSWMGCVCPD